MLKEIESRVHANGGLAVCTLGELRDLADKDKLGVYVLRTAAKKLDGVGLAFYPAPTEPFRQHHEVRVYRRDSPLGALVQAVTEPTERGDELLRATAKNHYATVIDKIRELVRPQQPLA
ncbi:hypothetical protein ACFV4N_34995 [Actinosynnema sp. NPDC059797]